MNPTRMTTGVLLAIIAIMATSAMANPAPTNSATQPGTPAPAPVIDDVLRLAPDDALAVAYTDNTRELLKHPILDEAPAGLRELRALLLPRCRTCVGLDGPTMFAFSGTPMIPMSWRFTFAARIDAPPNEIFDWLDAQLVPKWNATESLEGDMQFWRDGAIGHLLVVGPVPLAFEIAVRDGVMYATSMSGGADRWLRGEDMGPAFVDSDDHSRLTAETAGRLTGMVYVDLRTLMPLAAGPLGEALPELYKALQLDRLEFAGLVTVATEAAPAPGKRQRPDSGKQSAEHSGQRPVKPVIEHRQRLVVGLSSLDKGLWHAIASTPSQTTLARFFPQGTSLVVQGSMESAAAIADDIAAFANVIDPVIFEEYVQERAEFRGDLGFDFHTEFLTNLAGEWAIGGEIGPDGEPLVAVRLASAANFQTYFHRLRVAYQLETTPSSHRGVAIERAERHNGPFSFAVLDDVLLVTPSDALLRAAIDAHKDKTSLAHTKPYVETRRRLAGSTSKFVFMNVAAMLAMARETDEANMIPAVMQRLAAAKTLGISITPRDRAMAIDFVATGDDAPTPIDALATMLLPSFERSRHLSMRTISESQAKAILIGCFVFTTDNDKQWPRSLRELAASGHLGEPAQAAKTLSNPYEPGESPTKTYYLYRPLPDPKAVKEHWSHVVLSEPVLHDGGAVFGFLDGHVEWVKSPRADELMKVMRTAP